MRLRHQPQPQTRLRWHNVSLGFPGETVDYFERWFSGSQGSHDNAANAPRPIADGSQEREPRRDLLKSDPRALGGNALVQLSVAS